MEDPQKETLTVISETRMRKNSSADFVSGKMDNEIAYSSEKKGSSFGKLFVVGILAVALLGGLIATIVIYETQPPRREYGWWHSTTIYQIYPWSFMDSNNTGIGDLNGITSKVDYLKELGIETIWLSPVYPSPMDDFGYDISNYTDIYEKFGTLDDFDRMLKAMHAKDLKLFMDFVPNHSSDQHEWFIKSAQNDPKYSKYYIWHSGHPTRNITVGNTTEVPAPPNNWRSVFSGPAWTWHPGRGQYYYHAFLKSQPDLNWRHPELVEEMDNVFRFWLDRGVDGFRIDAVPFLFEQDGDIIDANETTRNPYASSTLVEAAYDYIVHPRTLNLPETYEQVRNWTRLMKEYTDKQKNGVPKFLIIEVVTKNTTIINGYYPEDPFITPTMPFYFGLIWMNNRTTGHDIERLVNDCLDKLPKGGWPTWNIGNHDQNRSTDRLGNTGLIDGLNMLNLLLPGTPTTYYGEEIGMRDAILTPDQIKDPAALNARDIDNDPNWMARSRDRARSPMQWNFDMHAGFSTNETTWLPVGPEWNETRNVEYQKNATRSHYKVYRKLIQIRKGPAFRIGTMRPGLINDNLYSFIRENLDQKFLVAIDLRRSGTEKVDYDFSDVVQGTGELVTASVNLYDSEGVLLDIGLNKPIKMDKVPLMPSGAIVLKLK